MTAGVFEINEVKKRKMQFSLFTHLPAKKLYIYSWKIQSLECNYGLVIQCTFIYNVHYSIFCSYCANLICS